MRIARLVQDFSALPDWEHRYKKLIEYGKKLGDLPDDLKQEKFKVRGCQSQVWLHANEDESGRVVLRADSDAMIVKGLVALLLEIYSNATPDEILATSPQFLKDLGFETHLSPNRANGLYAMVKQIFYYAQAFKALAALKK